MDPERWREVDHLFEEALDRPPAERSASLDAARAGDNALRREVERLLATDEQGAGFLAGEREPLGSGGMEERQVLLGAEPQEDVRKSGPASRSNGRSASASTTARAGLRPSPPW